MPVDVYKHLQDVLTDELVELFNHCLEGDHLFPEGHLVSICLIFKKGDPKSLKNWRPISLSNADYKLLTRIMSNRLMKLAPKIIHKDH